MKKEGKDLTAMLSAIIFIYLAEPFFFWGGFWRLTSVRIILSYILGLCFLLNRKPRTTTENLLFILMLGTLILYPIVGGYNINFLISLLPVVTIPFVKEGFSQNVYKYFVSFFSILLALGLFFWVLALLGIVTPTGVIPPLNPLKENYYTYPFFVRNVRDELTRFCGAFDEPGVVGTMCGIMLCVEKMNLRKWQTIVLLIAGLSSLSLFFYVIIVVYFFFYFAFEKKSLGKATLLFLLVAGVFFLSQKIPVLQESIGTRLEWDSEKGGFSGDNRMNYDLADYYLVSMISSNQIWFGIENKDAFMAETQGNSSFLMIVILNGIVFSILYIMFFGLYGYYYRKNFISFLLFFIVFVGVIYQRPNTFQFVYVFLFSYFAKLSRIERLV